MKLALGILVGLDFARIALEDSLGLGIHLEGRP